MLRFTCPYCAVNLTAGENRAGKKVLCPRCKGKIQLPNVEEPETPLLEVETELQLIDPPKPLDGALLDLADKQSPADTADQSQLEEQLRSSVLPPPAPEYTGERKLPWPIDILLYPLSAPGLTILGILIAIPMLINLVAGLLGPFGFFVAIPGFPIIVVIKWYFLWYMAQCILDSALGGVRAPETMSQTPGIWEIIVQTGRTLACIAVAVLPLMIYWGREQKVDATFWSLVTLATILCPMALLAVTMHDSIGGLNPFLLIRSVFRTFPSYLGFLLILGPLVFLMVWIFIVTLNDPVLSFTFGNAKYYPILVAAHLLGRFYWRNRERLDWVV